jgi:hypothetical protein
MEAYIVLRMKRVLHVPSSFLATLKILKAEENREDREKFEAARNLYRTLGRWKQSHTDVLRCDKKTFQAYRLLVGLSLKLWELELDGADRKRAKRLRRPFHNAVLGVLSLGEAHCPLVTRVMNWWWKSPLFSEAQASS